MHNTNTQSRIPAIAQPITRESVVNWFSALNAAGLDFHPEDDPRDIMHHEGRADESGSGANLCRTFDDDEAALIESIIENISEALPDCDICALALVGYGITPDAD